MPANEAPLTSRKICHPLAFLGEGGAMGERIHAHDWAATPLGPLQTWPRALLEALRLCLCSSFPTAVVWGADLRMLYNDAWTPLLGERHPAGLGCPLSGALPAAVESKLRAVLATGRCAFMSDQRPAMRRGGRVEDKRWSYSFTPILDEDAAVAGIFLQGQETTPRARTEREQVAEAALAVSEERLQSLFDQSLSGIAETDLDGRFLRVNRRYCVIAGHTAAELLQMRMQDLTHPDDQARSAEHFNALIHGWADDFAIEKRYVRGDGSVVWVHNFVGLVRDAEGQPRSAVATTLDITESRALSEALRQQRRLYEAILNNTPDLAYVFDLDHRFVYANDALLRMWGKPLAEAIGKTCLELGYEPWHAAMHDREIEQVVATREPIRGKVPFTGTAGRRIYDYIFVPVLGANGEVEAVAGTTRDITEYEQIEAALREARLQLDSALRAGEIGTFVWDIGTDRLYGDRNFNLLFGIPLTSAGSPLDGFLESIHPEDRESVLSLVRRTIDTGCDYEAEYRIVAGGRPRWVIARGKIERDQEGRAVRFPGVLLDITDRKLAEEALREADRRKDEFLATLSHELRNPLAPIRQAVTLLGIPGLPERDAHRAREIIDRQSRHMSWLLDDLLDVARITRGVLVLRKEPVELSSAVDAAVEVARPLIDANRHALSIELPSQPVVLEADPLRLSQVIANLLTNASKYTDAGGRIALQARVEGAQLMLSVTDNGVGISADMLPRIFEMFTQVNTTLDRSQGGLGIGLALVRGLVELHGGTVVASSSGLSQGSTFTVCLPLATAAAARMDGARAAEKPQAASAARKVLLADDNRDAADSLKLLLTTAGYEVRAVHDGHSALAAAAEFRPDVALLDIGMPGLSGYELAKLMRAESWGNGVVLIAVTGWGQEEDKRRAIGAGFDHHLTKPVEFPLVQALLDDRRRA